MTNTKTGKFIRQFQKNKCANQGGGFTLLGLLVEIIIIGAVTLVLLERLMYYQEYAEKTVMEVTIRNIRNGLQLRIADLMMHDNMKEVGGLLNENPIVWLDAPPPNYLGVLKVLKNTTIPRGCWYFDVERKELVYLPNHRRFFESGFGGDEAIRYQTSAMKYSQGKDKDHILMPEGIALNLVNPYKWKLTIQ